MTSPQSLSDAERRTVARWAEACAERVLPLVETDADPDARDVVLDALARTRAYATGESTAADEIRRRLIAGRAANSASTPAGAAAARSVAQAAAVAHMGAHALGAAAYAVKAVALSAPDRPEAVDEEVRWQLAALREEERAALRQLPLLGTDSAGPLGEGLLARGLLGATIRRLQAAIASDEGAR